MSGGFKSTKAAVLLAGSLRRAAYQTTKPTTVHIRAKWMTATQSAAPKVAHRVAECLVEWSDHEEDDAPDGQ